MSARAPARGRFTLSLRTSLGLVVLGSVAYAVGIAVYLALRVAPAAASLEAHTQPVLYLFGDLQDRARTLAAGAEIAHRLVATRGDAQARAAIRALPGVIEATPRVRPDLFAAVPQDLRLALARADWDVSYMQSALAEILALDELRLYDEAGSALASLDRSRDSLVTHLADAQRYGLRDLVEREQALTAASQRAARAVLWWVMVGALALVVAFVLVRGRLTRPLAALESALVRVSDGDLTARVPVERADEVGRLATHFNQMTRVLLDRVEGHGRLAAVGELLAGVAHEVSNPLMAIIAQTESRLAEPDLSVERRLELLRILRQARRGGRLLSRVLQFSRPSGGVLADADLVDVILEAVDLVAHRCVANEVTVDNRVDLRIPRVRGDAMGLEQVFVNLLSNAIDAACAGPGPRRITLTSDVSADRVEITVADSGPGVAAEIVDDLFKPFATDKARRGVGLGLYLSRRIVRAANGTLELRSAPGEGARFVVGLRRARVSGGVAAGAAQGPVVAAVPDGQTLAGLRVLVADDEEGICREVAGYLRKRGATAMAAQDGVTALRILQDLPVDAIVLDLRMPRMDWLTFLTKLWASRPELGDRVIVLSGDPESLAEVRGLALPAERILVKPVDLAVLEGRIRDLALGAQRGG